MITLAFVGSLFQFLLDLILHLQAFALGHVRLHARRIFEAEIQSEIAEADDLRSVCGHESRIPSGIVAGFLGIGGESVYLTVID